MRNTRAFAALLATLLAFLAGCASTPEASLSSDADAKRFDTAPNAAIVYIYRPTGAGRGVSTLWVNGRLVGESLPRTFYRVPVRPGRTRLTTSANDAGKLEFDTQVDGVYFVEARVEGETQSEAATTFRRIPPESGKAAIVSCCRMLETWRPGQDRLNF